MEKICLHESTPPIAFSRQSLGVIIGASGAIGHALLDGFTTSEGHSNILAFSRSQCPNIDVTDEASIVLCASHIKQVLERTQLPLSFVINATGHLHGDLGGPEKSLKVVNSAYFMEQFAINAIGPALLMKHIMPLMPRQGRSVFANLSARVGSIGDNRIGGWYGYRAAKAALNQIIRTASVEMNRTHPDLICVALHPGTVKSPLSAPFSASVSELQSPEVAALRLIEVIKRLRPEHSGCFFDHMGKSIAW